MNGGNELNKSINSDMMASSQWQEHIDAIFDASILDEINSLVLKEDNRSISFALECGGVGPCWMHLLSAKANEGEPLSLLMDPHSSSQARQKRPCTSLFGNPELHQLIPPPLHPHAPGPIRIEMMQQSTTFLRDLLA
jgi:hypothetical protein